jgi:hypothetical protein
MVRTGEVGQGAFWQGRLGPVGSGSAWTGLACYGGARFGQRGQGSVRCGRWGPALFGSVRYCTVLYGVVRQVGHGISELVPAAFRWVRYVVTGLVRQGQVRFGQAGLGR